LARERGDSSGGWLIGAIGADQLQANGAERRCDDEAGEEGAELGGN
jgi:hypothetical protein